MSNAIVAAGRVGDALVAESAAGAPAITIADLHRYRRAGAATVRRLLSGSLPRGAHCRLTPDAAVRAVPPWLLLLCLRAPGLLRRHEEKEDRMT